MMPERQKYTRPALVKSVVIAYDLGAAALTMFVAVALRYALIPGVAIEYELALLAAGLFALACAIVFPIQGLHRGVWRFTNLNDALQIAYAIALANLLFLVVLFFFNRLTGLPRSSLIIEAPLLFAALIGARFARQIYASGDWRLVARLEDRSLPPAILVGRHTALDAYLRDALRRPGGPPFRIRGLVTPDGADRGRSIGGRPVLGGAPEAERALMSLGSVRGAAPQLVLVDPGLKRLEIDRFVSAAHNGGGMLVRANGDPTRPKLSPLEAADLIGRMPRSLDVARPRALIQGKRVLVTGAGGTIGAELTRQVARFDPALLILLDSSEFNLYEIDRELREAGFGRKLVSKLGDVRDRRRVETLMQVHRPDVVLHAAALKHVPLMEENPTEAVLTNVLGTINVAECARASGARRLVLISTDKAVSPTNVMGASKRAAELFVQAIDQDSDFRATAVRFGNVLGSAGSVIPLFERQIQNGGPITVTHADMTRYFMTLDEAAALVLQAAAADVRDEPRGGIYVLDMGEPVGIEHLARQLCRLRGLDPDRDIRIVHTGLRPGEKVHERLFHDSETVEPTKVDGVLMARARQEALDTLRHKLDRLIEAARARDVDRTHAAILAITPDFDAPIELLPETA
jgi:O-antigen biosynthesis protein WbqV